MSGTHSKIYLHNRQPLSSEDARQAHECGEQINQLDVESFRLETSPQLRAHQAANSIFNALDEGKTSEAILQRIGTRFLESSLCLTPGLRQHNGTA